MSTGADVFQRTQSGKAAKPLFVAQVICYVEGTDDVAFFSPIRDLLHIKFEPAYGKPNALDLARKLQRDNLKYVVLLDGDFDAFLGKTLSHARIIYLNCYAIENLFWDSLIVQRAAADYVGIDEDDISSCTHLEDFEKANRAIIEALVTYDLACHLENCGRSLCPRHCDEMLNGVGLKVKNGWLSSFEKQAKDIPSAFYDDAKNRLNLSIHPDSIAFYLRGHLAFGIVRRAFLFACQSNMGRKPQMEARTLLRLLGEAFWRVAPPFAEVIKGALVAAKASLEGAG